MRKFRDLTGQRFGRWLVLSCAQKAEKLPNGKKLHTLWNVLCDCGAEDTARADALLNGRSKSCGCLHAELTSERAMSHGLAESKEYWVWAAMLQRCGNPKHPCYHRYGGRGITVDPQWHDFENFYADMGQRPSDKHSIEREDNDGPYAAWNCVWATQLEQTNNTGRTVFLEFHGKTQSISQWCRELNLTYMTVRARLSQLGWTAEKALGTPTKTGFKERIR